MKNIRLSLVLVFSLSLLAGSFNALKAQYFVQEFESVSTLQNWVIKNNSLPLGPTTWEQGIISVFPAYSGTGYIRANFGSTQDPGNNGKISNWLISPVVTFHNGDVITFITRKTDSATLNYPDRMQVRLSLDGASADVGTTVNSLGDFTVLLKDINPGYSNLGYPTGYPYSWKRYSLAISGLSAPTTGRFAFRYYVEHAGNTGNSDYIGIDSVAFHMGVVGIEDVDSPLGFWYYPNPAKDIIHFECNTDIHSLTITDVLGNRIEEITIEDGKAQLNTTAWSAGIYFVTARSGKNFVTRKISIAR